MHNLIVLYSTHEGHTETIARYLAAALTGGDSISADAIDLAKLPAGFSLSGYNAVIIAASVHRQKHSPAMLEFVRRNIRALEAVPSAFLSVSLSQAGAEDPSASHQKRTAAADAARGMMQSFFMEAGWHPTIAKPVAGALRYTQYNWLMRFVMKQIARRSGGATDTSRDWVYTDWAGLDRLAEELTALIPAKKTAADSQPAWNECVLQ